VTKGKYNEVDHRLMSCAIDCFTRSELHKLRIGYTRYITHRCVRYTHRYITHIHASNNLGYDPIQWKFV